MFPLVVGWTRNNNSSREWVNGQVKVAKRELWAKYVHTRMVFIIALQNDES